MKAYKSNESGIARIGNYLLPVQGSLRGAEPAEDDALLRAQFVYALPAPVPQEEGTVHHLSALRP